MAGKTIYIRFLKSADSKGTSVAVMNFAAHLQLNQNENPVRNSSWLRIPYVNSGSFSAPQRV